MYEEHLIIMNRNIFIQEVIQKYKLVNGVQEAASYSTLPQKAVIINLCIYVHVVVGCIYGGVHICLLCDSVYRYEWISWLLLLRCGPPIFETRLLTCLGLIQ